MNRAERRAIKPKDTLVQIHERQIKNPSEMVTHAMQRVTDRLVEKASQECPTKTPEPHLLGEFPMSCYRCHLHADS